MYYLFSMFQASNCSLHLAQNFHSLFYLSRVSPILSKKSAVGLLLATGNVGAAIVGRQYNVYMSNDGGLVWKEVGNCALLSVSSVSSLMSGYLVYFRL